MGGERSPAYYAILPAKVRHDKTLRPNAKLLYAEITALADRTGYCWASNAYLADLYGLTIRAVQKLVKDLADRGYIAVEVLRDEQTNEVTERRLWVDRPALPEETVQPEENESAPHEQEFVTPHEQKFMTPHEQKFTQNNTRIEHTPYSPPEGDGCGCEQEAPKKVPRQARRTRTPKKAPDWKPERFAGFWAFYPRGEDKQAAIREWDKLRPTDELIDKMARALERQMRSEDWQRGVGIPYAARWLKHERWTDVAKEPPGAWEDGEDEPLSGEGVEYL